ncbi:MAG: FAD-dependent oxidoreductase [Synergistaceae bacterium]|nr:FAD-dependent oxidoreductase [Synergistaceae bacterium]
MKQTEILIIGGGPAGLNAALSASSLGARALLVERNYVPGGQLVKQTHKFFGSEKQYAGDRGIQIGRILTEKAQADPNIELWMDSTVLAIYDDGVVTVEHEGLYTKVKPERIIIAAGAAEKFLSFPGNDLPGIYGAGAVQTLMNEAGVKPAERVLMVGAGNIGLIVSYQLLQAGVEVAAVIEGLPKIGGYLVHASKIRRAGIPVLTRHTILEAYGRGQVEGAVIAQIDEKWRPIPGSEREIPCDTICLAVGLSPLTELAWQAGCEMAYIRELSGHVPIVDENMETTRQGIYCAGDSCGIEEASSAMVEGRLAGICAAASLGHGNENNRVGERAVEILKIEAMKELDELRAGTMSEHIRIGVKKLVGSGGHGHKSIYHDETGQINMSKSIAEAAEATEKAKAAEAAETAEKAKTAEIDETGASDKNNGSDSSAGLGTLLTDGIPVAADLASVNPSEARLKKGPVAIVECFQMIPCNPCVKACKQGAITMPRDINDLPIVDAELCSGCGRCIALCPGLAVFVVDRTYSEEMALVKLPYEFTPKPKAGQFVAGFDRAGKELGKFEVKKVTTGGKKNLTSVISLAVPQDLALEIRHIKVDIRQG